MGSRLKNFFSLCFLTFNGTFRWCLNVVQVWVFLLFEWCLNIVWALLGCRFSCCSNGVQVQLLVTTQVVFRCNFSLLFKQCGLLFFFLATWLFNCYICKLCIAWRELEALLNILLVILLSYLTISNQVPPPTSNPSLLLKWVKVGKNELKNVWTIFKNYFLKIWKIMGKLCIKFFKKNFKKIFILSKLQLQNFHENSPCFKSHFICLKHSRKACGEVVFCIKIPFPLLNVH